ncbi:MAG: SMC-Scp complex subunit ScpB [Actinomyces sp.]|jgi:segregation and condensation protein B|nr:SMC-Scp complex subunit ScpB [Actinomyces sp.]MCI1642032.1 SMC-Scp complex subunit ScpB [Actinomyces sp.]MCI1663302.1 SMC-Scp complex subunit ScpB [Actinomyces sp.]MCI1691928.1 SMC-Scp complex subunit ScpB [Actinomyces sp.]MCI1788733.1 SMC-Scp complex subunit ScpB [Actinomyces sp.]MCI1831117.1 SMC-Scp complex subunit ScpB [Actinomyces sp.]
MSTEELEGLFAPLEAVLMVTDRPVPARELAEALGVATELVEEALGALAREYRGEPSGRARGFELRSVAGGWRLYSAPAWADVVGRFVVGSDSSRLSQAALETLAVVAYRQPVTRSRISHVRGVNVDAVVRTLVNRGLIEEVGETESGARLYGTTVAFLERMGFDSLDDLVPLAPYLPASDQLDDLAHDLEETL